MPEKKTIHTPPFKFGVGEKVWVPGISDVGRVVERVRQWNDGTFQYNRYLMSYGSDRTGWYEEGGLESLSEGGLERAITQAVSRAYSDEVELAEEAKRPSEADLSVNGAIYSPEHYLQIRQEMNVIKKRLKDYEKWSANCVY